MAASRAFPLPSYRDDDLAAAGTKMLSRSVQRMSAKILKSTLPKPKAKSTKSVHFEAHLESVCYFMKDDEPCLIAARISAVKRTAGDCDPLREAPLLLHDSTCVLDLISSRREQDAPVRVEQVYLSHPKSVSGTLAVASLSFMEHVKVRFSLDGWQTASEAAAEYCGNHRKDGFDTFGFTIRLDDCSAAGKTMSFCVGYVANGQEFMGTNASSNYEIELSKLAGKLAAPPGILRPATPSPPVSKSRFAAFSRRPATGPAARAQAANAQTPECAAVEVHGPPQQQRQLALCSPDPPVIARPRTSRTLVRPSSFNLCMDTARFMRLSSLHSVTRAAQVM
ncbi:hypothetical protein LOZ66_006453 [Ophidiomyces ophidiicola]|nr:hypothetical protein LOZ66_006453 [Ophidiomyces ophidiicola]